MTHLHAIFNYNVHKRPLYSNRTIMSKVAKVYGLEAEQAFPYVSYSIGKVLFYEANCDSAVYPKGLYPLLGRSVDVALLGRLCRIMGCQRNHSLKLPRYLAL